VLRFDFSIARRAVRLFEILYELQTTQELVEQLRFFLFVKENLNMVHGARKLFGLQLAPPDESFLTGDGRLIGVSAARDG
jgi:hypothetical protein